MRHHATSRFALAAMLSMGGLLSCQAMPAEAPSIEQPKASTASLVVTPSFARRVAEVGLYSRASIDRVEVELVRVGSEETVAATASLSADQLDHAIRFDDLRFSTTYKVRALAYAADDTLISDTARSTVTVAVGTDPEPTVATVPVQLADRPYPTVSTLAGSGSGAYVEGDGEGASFDYPWGMAVDAGGNVYVGDTFNNAIRKITPEGTVSTLTDAGGEFLSPTGVAVDKDGKIYVADQSNHRIRKITVLSGGTVTVSMLAGSGTPAFADGTRTGSSFNYPNGVAVDASGNVYVADTFNHRIRKIDPSKADSDPEYVTTVAGSGAAAFANGTGTSASFNDPNGVAVDASGNLYVADRGNHRIRKIDLSKASTDPEFVTTLAGSGSAAFADGEGTSASFNLPFGVAVDAIGNVYVSEHDNHRVRKITPDGVVSTLAGAGEGNYVNGNGYIARFNSPHGVAVDATGRVYVADTLNNRIRVIE